MVVYAAWATLVLVFWRGGYFGFPVDALSHDAPMLGVFVVLPGVVLLWCGSPVRYAAGVVGVLLLALGTAEAVASWQERAFVARCHGTPGSTVIEQHRFGGRMLFLRGPDGSEAFHGFD